jgi:Ca2+-binding RTX toxin-like protein
MFSRPTRTHVERLENRWLLALTPVSAELVVPGADPAVAADLAVAADGSYLIASAVAAAGGTTANITAVRYSPSGVPVGSPITLDTTGATFLGINSPPIAASVDADGDAVVAYRRDDGVYVVRLSKDGVAGAPLRVDTTPADRFVHLPTVSMDDAGGFFVGWFERSDVAVFVQVRAFDADGAPRGPQFSPESASLSTGSFDGLDIAARRDGSGAIFAVGFESGEGGDGVLFGRVSTTGVIGDLGHVGSFGADVAVHPDGSFVIGYVVSTRPTSVRAQRYDADGTPVGDFISLDDLAPTGGLDSRTHSVSVDAMPDGGFVAAFVYTTRVGGSINPNRDVSTIYARRYDASGAPDAGGLVVINTPPFDNHGPQEGYMRPDIGADSDGSVVAVYVQPMATSNDTYVGPAIQRRLAVRAGRLASAELFVDGTDGEDHIIVERVRNNLFVNVNGIVERFDAASVQFLSISGLGGDDDIVNASAIPSTISGGDGADTLWGGTSADHLRGFGGDDVLHGGDGGDHLAGGGDDDRLFGDGGDDRVDGQLGGNTLVGGDGVDTLVSGNSFLDLEPDTGRLKFNGSDGGSDRVSVTREPLGRLAITIDGAMHRMYGGSVALIELNGWAGDDVFTVQGSGAPRASMRGGDGNDTLVGGPGNDTLNGQGGDDFVDGRDGDDRLDADGNATLHGGNGNDVLHASFGPSILRGGYGDDFLQGGAFADALYGDDGGNDSLAAGGGEHGHDTIEAGNGNDSLYGEGGHDLLDGEQDNDYLEGGAGNDTLEGGWNNDTMFGLAGNDRLLASEVFTVHPDVVRGGPGNDVAAIDEGADDVLAVETVT